MASANIHDYIAPGRRAHLVGIGGVSMSPLAEVLHKAGMVITCLLYTSIAGEAPGGKGVRYKQFHIQFPHC